MNTSDILYTLRATTITMSNSKVLLFALLGLIVFQGTYGETADYGDERGIIEDAISGILNAAMKVLDGLLDEFSKLADKVHLAVQNLVQKLASRIQAIVDAGSKVISNLADNLGSKIKEAVKLGLINAECATARTAEVSELVLNTTNNLARCPQKVEPVINEVVTELKTLMSSLSNLLADGPRQFKACVPEHATLLDLPRIGECVRKAVRAVVVDAAQFVGKLEHAITQSVSVSEQAAAQVASCALGATQEASRESKLILDHLSQCIAQQSSTTAAQGKSTPAPQ